MQRLQGAPGRFRRQSDDRMNPVCERRAPGAAARRALLASALLVLLSPAALRAQSLPQGDLLEGPRDTVRLAPRPTEGESRWTEPFAVVASGRVAPRPPRGEVVWVGPGAAPAARLAVADSVAPSRPPASRSDTAAAPRRPAAAPAPAERTPTRPTATAEESRTIPRGATSSAPPAATHTVAAGETFFAISRRYGVTTAQLRALNPEVDWERVRVGDVLRLPAAARDAWAGRDAPPPAGPSPAPRGGAGGRRTHTVERGETLFGIARRYGVSLRAIQEANGMDRDQVRIGERLVIPAS